MRRVVIGMGSPERGDDRAGLEVADRVTGLEVHRHRTGGYEMIHLWDGADEVILVDAARSGVSPGTIHRIDASTRPVPQGILPASTHSAGVAETVEMARHLGRLPSRVMIYGIEVGEVAPGSAMTPEVQRAVGQVVKEIEGA